MANLFILRQINFQNLGIASLNVLISKFKNFFVLAINSSNGKIKMKITRASKKESLDPFVLPIGRKN